MSIFPLTETQAQIRRLAQQNNVVLCRNGTYRERGAVIGRVDQSEQKVEGGWVRGWLASTVSGPVFKPIRDDAVLAVLTGGVA